MKDIKIRILFVTMNIYLSLLMHSLYNLELDCSSSNISKLVRDISWKKKKRKKVFHRYCVFNIFENVEKYI